MKASSYIFLIMAGVIAFLIWRLNRVAAARDSSAAVLQEKEAEITYFKAQSGKTVGVKPAAEISKSDLQKHYSDMSADLKDMKVELSRLRTAVRLQFQAIGKGEAIIVRDTIRLPGLQDQATDSVFVNDGYLSLKARIGQTFRYKYAYQDSVIVAVSGKKKWVFGNEVLQGTVKFGNPNARAINQTAVVLQGARDKRFNVSIGAGYDPLTNQVRPGIYVGYSVFKF
jgi:hypothetical protein